MRRVPSTAHRHTPASAGRWRSGNRAPNGVVARRMMYGTPAGSGGSGGTLVLVVTHQAAAMPSSRVTPCLAHQCAVQCHSASIPFASDSLPPEFQRNGALTMAVSSQAGKANSPYGHSNVEH